MPKTAQTREQIEQQAAELAAQIEEFHEQDRKAQEERWHNRTEAQRQWDEDFVAGYSYARTEVEVGDARRALDEALAADPIVQAFAHYLAAMRRRYQLVVEKNAAMARLGRPEPLRLGGMQTELIGLEDFIFQAAERIGAEQVSAEMAELQTRRDAAGAEG